MAHLTASCKTPPGAGFLNTLPPGGVLRFIFINHPVPNSDFCKDIHRL